MRPVLICAAALFLLLAHVFIVLHCDFPFFTLKNSRVGTSSCVICHVIKLKYIKLSLTASQCSTYYDSSHNALKIVAYSGLTDNTHCWDIGRYTNVSFSSQENY